MTAGSELVRAEIARHRWARMVCGCADGDARHIPINLERIAVAQTRDDASLGGIVHHVNVDSAIYEPARATVQVALAGLAGEISVFARRSFLGIVLDCVSDMDFGNRFGGTPNRPISASRSSTSSTVTGSGSPTTAGRRERSGRNP